MLRDILHLGWHYVTYHRLRSWLLVAALSLTLSLPLAARWTVFNFERNAQQRAQSTPLLVGAKGSRFALALHGLMFLGEAPPTIPYQEYQRIIATGYARALPILARFQSRGQLIVATSSDYLRHRELTLANGQPWQRLGDCLVGAAVAKRLRVGAGEYLMSEPLNAFDISGPAPLNLRITGVLNPTGTADDEVILCDLPTGWIMEGIGHAHGSLNTDQPSATSQNGQANEHVHSASREFLQQPSEITAENVSSFHFHGRRDQYPLTAIIALPPDERSETLLLGQYLSPDQPQQIIRPVDVMNELSEMVIRIRRLFEAGSLVLSLATALLVGLVVILSTRLRERELRMFAWMGCSRLAIARILMVDLAFIAAISTVTAVLIAYAISTTCNWIVTQTIA